VAQLDETLSQPATTIGSAPPDEMAGAQSETPVNEIVKTAQQAKEEEAKAAQTGGDNRTAWIAAGVGVGIGSAALVAALLYANRDKGKDKKKD
jgi:hypothetical protein